MRCDAAVSLRFHSLWQCMLTQMSDALIFRVRSFVFDLSENFVNPISSDRGNFMTFATCKIWAVYANMQDELRSRIFGQPKCFKCEYTQTTSEHTNRRNPSSAFTHLQPMTDEMFKNSMKGTKLIIVYHITFESSSWNHELVSYLHTAKKGNTHSQSTFKCSQKQFTMHLVGVVGITLAKKLSQ